MRNLSGVVIDNRYLLGDLTGRGSLGSVYRATDQKLQRPVALKILGKLAISARELRLLAGLRGSNLATILDFNPFDEGFYLVTPWLAGPPVTQISSAPMEQRLRYALEIAKAVAFLHSRNGRHGRVHPNNVRLNSAETTARIVVCDSNLPLVELELWPLAALPYLSPEHLLKQPVSRQSDVYSSAALIYELLSGKQAFPARDLPTATTQHVREQPAPLAHWLATMPEKLDSALMRALNKQPARRGSADDLVSALGAAMAGVSGTALARRSFGVVSARNLTPAPAAPAVDLPTTERPADRLRIRLRNEISDEYLLSEPIVRLGRAADNDIVLDDIGSAAYQMRLERTQAGWSVVDLGDSAEVYISSTRLVANTAEPWLPGVPLKFGEYELSWRSGLDFITADDTDDVAKLSFISAAAAESAETVEDIVISLAPAELSLAPGETDTFILTLHNREQIVAHCLLDQSGVPPEWIAFSTRALQLLPQQTGEVVITVSVTASPDVLAGTYPFELTLATSVTPEPTPVATGIIRVESNATLLSTLEPTSIRSPGAVAVTLQNEGNAPIHCTVTARDESDALRFNGLPVNVTLDPFRSNRVAVSISGKSRRLLGTSTVRPFTVSVAQHDGEQQNHIGLVEVRPYLPVWLVPVAMLVVVFGCATIAILLAGWNARQEQRAVATEQAQVALDAARAEAAANQPTATPGPFAASCAELVAVAGEGSALEDGDFTIYVGGSVDQPVTVFCHAMDTATPAEYLTVLAEDASQNYALTRADGDFYIGTDVRTHYEKVRFDPLSLTIVLTDTTFATSSGSISYEPEGADSAETINFTPYATAASCRGNIFPGEANVTLTGLPLQIADAAQFVPIGVDAVGEPPLLSDDRQIVALAGGGRCGRLAPQAGLQLNYLAAPDLIGGNESQ